MGPSHQKPLHKSIVFLILMALTAAFWLMSVILYLHVKESEDDDLVSGGGIAVIRDKLHHHGKHHHKKKRGQTHREEEDGDEPESHQSTKAKLNADLADLYQGKDPKDAIAKFQQDREYEKDERRRKGISTRRESFESEAQDPDDWERIRKSVDSLRQPEIPTQSASQLPYDIHDCPLAPPPNYPFSWNVMDVLDNWNPDETEILPSTIYQGVCVFDWNKEGDEEKAENYRQSEVPFVIQNYPESLRASERWMTSPNYLEELIGDESIVTEHSRTNHFQFWSTKSPKGDQPPKQEFVPPTDLTEMTYPKWLEKAKEVEKSRHHAKEEHWYLRLNAMLHNHAYLYEELPFFDPSFGKSLTMVTPEEHCGINCRFGMKGTIAEAHYDSYNNFLAMMGGRRRFILAHPDQCENLELYPMGHPSARHSRINWSNAYNNWHDSERLFAQSQVNELVLQPGDILFLPTFWFHFIVSLTTTYQCNSRSGASLKHEHHISKCGFGPRTEYQRKDIS